MDTNIGENKKLVVLGVYENKSAVDSAVERFKGSGFKADDISVLMPSGEDTKEFAHEKGTKAPEGAAAGGTTGAILGGTLGWLVGIGSLAIPGVGPLVAAGPLMSILAGAGLGGTVGALSGALIGLGIPEYEAKRYESHVKEGGILVSVHCDNRDYRDTATKIFEDTGAKDISSSSTSAGDTSRAANY